ncbi:MAG: PilZ domain-containing protein [Treponema sp.]|jgi:hypothetical protein|nr:PilZ domain-containing protein [Treponema sp.]
MANQFSTQYKRKHPRYISRAKAYIMRILDEEAVVKDIGITGCCIAYNKKQVNLKLHEIYVIHVLPEDEKLEKFELLAESRWFHSKGDSCEIGFSIISSPYLFSQYKHQCRRIR